MNKILNIIKNWWDGYKPTYSRSIDDYKFEPDKEISAYEMYLCQSKPHSMCYKTIDDYETAIDKWYVSLPENCKRYLILVQSTCVSYKQYE